MPYRSFLLSFYGLENRGFGPIGGIQDMWYMGIQVLELGYMAMYMGYNGYRLIWG